MHKVIIVGANFAGINAARVLLEGGCNVVIYERQAEIGYMGASFPLWVMGKVKEREQLFHSNIVELADAGAKVSTSCEVLSIDFSAKNITVRDKFGREFKDDYDYLILATGSRSRQFPVAGMDLDGIHYAKFFSDANACVQRLAAPEVKRVAVIGGGYIGCELAEACKKHGKDVLLLETDKQLLPTHFDPEFAEIMQDQLELLGVKIHFSRVRSFVGKKYVEQIVHEKGVEDVQLVLFCVGFYPVAEIGDELQRTIEGSYIVDEHQETNIKGVFAIGDCCANFHQIIGKHRASFFASNAMRTAHIAARRILGRDVKNPGSQNSSVVLIDKLYLGSTGITMRKAEELKIEVGYSDFTGKQFPAFMAVDNPDVKLRLLYRLKERVLVGVQIASQYDISSALNYYSLAIQERLSIEELSLMDLFFMPHFNHAYNYHMLAALGAS
ncbi:MAG: FAD-dependent oxidoreductase [Bradymonadia bacterium]|jgi:NADPH-dependent 2,4-dienoyl-CoA reductase/sulfur reductase-like enzyme